MLPDLYRLYDAGATFIAVNDSFKLFPSSTVLHFGDDRWWEWNKAVLPDFKGKFVTTSAPGQISTYADAGYLYFEKWQENGLVIYPPYPPPHEMHRRIAGNNSGHQAINLSLFMGAEEIVLVGFDMIPAPDGKMQWHNNHQTASDPMRYQEVMAPGIDGLAEPLYGLNKRIFNVSPTSTLKKFPFRKISSFGV